MKSLLINAFLRCVRWYILIWAGLLGLTILFGSARKSGESDWFLLEFILPLFTAGYLSTMGWFSFWRRTAPSIRQFWMGVITLFLGAQFATHVLSLVFAVLIDGHSPWSGQVNLAGCFFFLAFTVNTLLMQLLVCMDTGTSHGQIVHVHARWALGYFGFLLAFVIFIVIAHYSGVVAIVLAEAAMAGAVFLGNVLMRHSIIRLHRLRLFYASLITIAAVATAIVSVR